MTQAKDILVAGAGLSGAVLARRLAEAGMRVVVTDPRGHVGGMCHTERCPETGVLVHRHGPHIFHTDDVAVWDLVNRYARFRHYRHRVFTTTGGQVYSLPVNLATINQFYGRALLPDQARAFVGQRCVNGQHAAQSFEELALEQVGPELYEAFFKGYTQKQWGCDPGDLPAAVLRRLPLRFSYDDSYFAHRFQGLPEEGYTALVSAMLDHPGITVALGTALSAADAGRAAHLFWTGPIDNYFGRDLGMLGYRTVDFEHSVHHGDWQGCAVMNYGDAEVPWTRITEHKHFAPWETHAHTVITREYARGCGPDDVPYYPIRLQREKALLRRYVARVAELRGVTFLGRLGTYRYLDMDVCIREAMQVAACSVEAWGRGEPPPVFSSAPL